MAIDTIKSSAVLDGAIATADIADDAVTGAKIENNPTIAGNLTVSGNFTSQGINDDADAVAMTIDSGENVAIGVTSKNSANNGSLTIGHTGMTKITGTANGNADELVLIGANASANVGMSIIANNANISGIFFGDEDDTDIGRIEYNHSDDTMRFYTNTAEQLRLHQNGVLAASDGIALGVGANNTASNVLDDYEEGTFTPTLVSTGATFQYSVRQGIYTKIGDLVTFTIVVQLDGGGNSFSGNSVALNGWPFQSRNSQGAASRFFIAGRYLNLDLGNGYTYAYAGLNGNSSSAPLYESGDNVPTQNLTSNDLSSSSGQLYLHGHYFTDS